MSELRKVKYIGWDGPLKDACDNVIDGENMLFHGWGKEMRYDRSKGYYDLKTPIGEEFYALVEVPGGKMMKIEYNRIQFIL